MTARWWIAAGLVVCLSLAGTALAKAQETGDEGSEGEATEELEQVDEVIVVTASRTEQKLHEVPAAISVLTSEALEEIPADDFGDYLRNVPGLNVSQISARDIQISGRQATNSLAASTLVLLDGRTLYLDFFGFVMWDLVPLDPREIKQIEVVRGPGSAVWGANAQSGVINLITKSPRELAGTNITLGGGEFSTLYGSLTHSGVNGKLSYKLSGAYYEQDPYDRPTGTVPGTEGPANPGGTEYPPFQNQGTEQPKGSFRLDYDSSEDTVWSFSGGYAATDGIIHTGIGPFDIQSGTNLSFVKGSWSRRAAMANFFVNLLDGDADNLLTVGTDGLPLRFGFDSETYNFDFSNTSVVGENQIWTYGVTARNNQFDLSIAPLGSDREEYGAFVQDELLLGDKVRWLLGARWDDIDPIGSVFSPRTSFLYSPTPDHTFRASFNRAFKAPSLIQNFLDITILNAVDFGPPIGLYIFPTLAMGNVDLQEERTDAIEVGYVGTFGRTTFTLAVYRNETTDSQDFFQAAAYTGSAPPPGFPLPTFLLDVPPELGGLAGLFPSLFSYRNIGETIDKGVEMSLEVNPSTAWSVFFNYSYQEEPEVTGIDEVTLPNGTTRPAVNTPPEHRANLGIAYSGPTFFANANVNYQDEAFWTDVLDSRFWGPTDSYTQVNLGAGVNLGANDSVTLSVTAQNVFDEDVQQHVFGDILARKVTGQVAFRF